MSSIFPLRDTVTQDEQGGPRLVDLNEEAADEVFEALAAQTTRQIFLALHEQPQTASDLATETDTSVQNVQYHLEKLQEVDLVDAVDTWYSERGSEMKVYAPTDESLVLFAGDDKQGTFRSIVNRFVGVASVLAPASLLASWAASRSGNEETTTTTTVDELEREGGESIDVETIDMPEGGVQEVQEMPSDGIEIASEEALTNDTIYMQGNETAGSEVILAENGTSSPILITDGGNATQIPEETLTTTVDAGGLDPAIAAGIAFFLGGLFVLAALWAWYGTPE